MPRADGERRLRDQVLREALGEIVAAKNTRVIHEGGEVSLVLDAESKMRAIAARALMTDASGDTERKDET